MADVKRIALMASSRSVPGLYEADAEKIYNLHGGNTGNVAFVNAISSHLDGEVNFVSWDASPEQLKRSGEVVVIACANQLGPHTDLGRTAANLDKAGLPILALGLGAQANSQGENTSVTDGTRRWIEVIAAHAPSAGPNIGVRGRYTLQQLERLGLPASAAVIGCPSNFTNLSFDYVAAVERRRAQGVSLVACAMGHPFSPALAAVEQQILDLVDRTEGTCVVQHGLSMIKLALHEFDRIEASLLEQTRRYFRPHLTLEEFKTWCRKRVLAFADVDHWMAWTKRYDFVVGPRFHGVMLALQAGVPAGCIAHDSRTLEMCQTMGIPVRMFDSFEEPLTLDNLGSLFPFDASAYRDTRAALAKEYVSILQAADLQYDERLDTMAGRPSLALFDNAIPS
ncbi:polysaccharide pyruvyl transferase family protein [Microvirga sp. VF16]|uniref:polysaccharide pyruvyl transferase family protein n=1 Tax=Microvirga sp. VF16 TaxID=2807101 RepID=UPI00193D1173|nr:polysaccharide pyruvyl transferase family protein [Microvirga sp. VF16]QRM35599.1 polysaccharide pyruvyl transferase family protein [Microvirga sp. VF16]